MSLDLIDVVRIAREFAETAGWGYFRVVSVNYNKEIKAWELTAFLGAYTDIIMKFTIDDKKRQVIKYEPENLKKE